MSQSTNKFTFEDLLKFRASVNVCLKFESKPRILPDLCLVMGNVYFRWQDAYSYFLLFLPNLKERTYNRIIRKKRRDDFLLWELRRKNKPFLKNTGRLFPLPKSFYNDFANRLWYKRGRPVFRKQIVSGCQWGKGEVVTNGMHSRYKKVITRELGCSVRNGKLVFICPD